MLHKKKRIKSLVMIIRTLISFRRVRFKGRIRKFKMKPKLAIRKDNRTQQRKKVEIRAIIVKIIVIEDRMVMRLQDKILCNKVTTQRRRILKVLKWLSQRNPMLKEAK